MPNIVARRRFTIRPPTCRAYTGGRRRNDRCVFGDPARHRFHQWSVRNLIEVATQIGVDHGRVPKIDQAIDGLDRIQRILAGAVRILLGLQVGFEDGFKYQHRRRLNNPVLYGRYPKWTQFPASQLRDVVPSDRLRTVGAAFQTRAQTVQVGVQIARVSLDGHVIDPGRSTAITAARL